MSDRLSPLDVSFLYLEGPTTPMHVGGVLIFEPPRRTDGTPDPAGFDYERLVLLVSERIALVPRYRQKVRSVPGNLANPVWVDDPDFDVTYHVRRSALPRPGTEAQLRELVARLQSRPLDRQRPLWEAYLVEGLEGGRFALISKTHHAMVDGIAAVDIATVILDDSARPRELPQDRWNPAQQPGRVDLVTEAVADLVRRPTAVVDAVRVGAMDARATASSVLGAAGRLMAAARTVLRPPPSTPLNTPIGAQRRYGTASTSLDDYKRVRKTHGGTVNDVVLAVVAGALRTWLLTRGEPMPPTATVRAMVPVSVRTDAERGEMGNRVSSYFVDLPIGETEPVVRLAQVTHAMRGHKENNQAIGAASLVALSGFSPPTLHSLGARAANSLTNRVFNVVVTNVPGPQHPLYAAGAKLLAAFPVVPLAKNQAVSIGLTSYDGGVYFGLNADRDAMPDVDVLAQCLEESLAELVGTVR